MKKMELIAFLHCRKVKKLLRVMKLTTIILLVCLMQVSATVYSQSTKFNFKIENKQVADVLKEIEESSNFRFFYLREQIDVERTVSVDVDGARVEDILDEIFEGRNVSYEVMEDNLILISPKEGLINNSKSQGQQKNIEGNVTDSSGEPLPGVSIIIKGTTTGTITDFDGKFNLVGVPADATLVFSFVGMRTQEVETANQSSFNIVMEEDAIGIEEVVAIGYGTKSKATLTGAVSTVSSDVLEDKPQPSVINSLQGIIPGLQITRGGGSIGDEGQGIQLRGITSRKDPGVLVIVDGIPQSFTSALGLSNLNPADVENITVLKDAQAAIYGARAAGGVILVTTKNGKKGKPKFRYTNNFALRVPAKMPEKVDLNQMIEMSVDAWTSDGIINHRFADLAKNYPYKLDGTQTAKGPFPDTPDILLTHFDWWDYIFGSALSQKHDFSVSGATERSNYFLSVGYLKEESMLNFGENEHKKYFTRAKYSYDIGDWLNVGANFYLEKRDLVRPTELESTSWGRFYWTIENTWTSQVPFNPAGNTYGFGGGDFRTPRAWLEKNGNEYIENYRIRPTFEFTMKPLEGLEVKGQYSLFLDFFDVAWQTKHFSSYSWDNVWLSQNRRPEDAAVGSKYHKHTQQVVNLYANYKKSIEKHHFDVMIGGSHEETWRRGFEASISDLITPTLPVMNIGNPEKRWIEEFASDWAIDSYFGRFSYNYSNKYFLEAIMRYDGSSKFADGHRWGSFPGISAGWTLTEEDFMSSTKNVFNYLKLRASYGELGNQNNLEGLYEHFSLVNTGNVYPLGSYSSPSRALGAWMGAMTSKTRTWETIKTQNIGIDAYFLDNRLSVTADYFIKTTEDMLVGREFPEVLGATPPTVNGGTLEVKGYELNINWKDKMGDFNYDVQFVFSDNKAKVTSLEDDQIADYGWNDFVEGYSPGTLFAFKYDGHIQNETELDAYKQIEGVPGNLRVGDSRFLDLDGDGQLERRLYNPEDPEGGDMLALANNNQRYQFGAIINCSYKNFDFSATLQGVGKWMVTDGEAPLGGGWWRMPEVRYYGKTWTEDRTDAFYPRLTANGGINWWNYYQHSDAPYELYNNKYLRLKSLTLGYTLPKHWVNKIKVDNCRVYFSGFDLFELQNIPKYSDPERPFVAQFTPFSRSFSLGLDLTF